MASSVITPLSPVYSSEDLKAVVSGLARCIFYNRKTKTTEVALGRLDCSSAFELLHLGDDDDDEVVEPNWDNVPSIIDTPLASGSYTSFVIQSTRFNTFGPEPVEWLYPDVKITNTYRSTTTPTLKEIAIGIHSLFLEKKQSCSEFISKVDFSASGETELCINVEISYDPFST